MSEFNRDSVLVMVNGELVSIDVDLGPLIFSLNENNYKTYFCCSGHAGKEVGYLMFANNPRNFELLSKLLDTLDNNEPVIKMSKLRVNIEISPYPLTDKLDGYKQSLCLRWWISNDKAWVRAKKMFKDLLNLCKED